MLLYHRVFDSSYDPQQLCVSPQNFYEQLAALKKTHRFLDIETFCDHLSRKKKFPKNSALITFDDGYADNFQQALPVLSNLELQAVFYVATANIGTGKFFWWDEVDLRFHENREASSVGALRNAFNLSGDADLHEWVIGRCKQAATLEDREMTLDTVRAHLHKCPENVHHRPMSLDELRNLAASPQAVIGAHTVNHLSLGHLSYADQDAEIRTSVKQLSHWIGKPVRHFAFPYGDLAHFNDSTLSICKKAGLGSAAANLYAMATPDSHIYSFPRVIVRNHGPATLLNRIREFRR